MRILKGFGLVVVLSAFMASTALANGTAAQAKKIRGAVVTHYDTKNRCVTVCKGPKPFLAYLEDGLAYALDIPLAILSPITCPIVSPLLERFDSGRNRTYSRSRGRK